MIFFYFFFFFFSSRRRHTRLQGDWSSDVCSSDLEQPVIAHVPPGRVPRVAGMIENGDAYGFSVHGTEVIAPVSAFAPGFVVADPGAVDDMAMTDFALEAHSFS